MFLKKGDNGTKSWYAIIVIEESMVIKTPQFSFHFYDFQFCFILLTFVGNKKNSNNWVQAVVSVDICRMEREMAIKKWQFKENKTENPGAFIWQTIKYFCFTDPSEKIKKKCKRKNWTNK